MAKNKHAVALGRLGGNRNTPAQQAARSANGRKGGQKPKYILTIDGLKKLVKSEWVLVPKPYDRAAREAIRRIAGPSAAAWLRPEEWEAKGGT